MMYHAIVSKEQDDILQHLEERLAELSLHCRDDTFLLRGLTRSNYIMRLSEEEAVFNLSYYLAQTVGQGCCYFDGSIEASQIDEGMLGDDIRHLTNVSKPQRIAMLDAVFASLKSVPSDVVTIEGSNIIKAHRRAEIVLEEVVRIAQRHSPKSGKKWNILNVGVVGSFLAVLSTYREFKVVASDLYGGSVGKTMHGVTIQDGSGDSFGSRTLELVSAADVAVVTGMTLANGTLSGILQAARQSSTSLVIFAETGANFASEYRLLGVECVVSEPYPFYLVCPGPTRIEIYR